MRDVADVQTNTFGLARRAGGVDDGGEIRVRTSVRHLRGRRIRCSFLQNIIKENKPSRVRPLRRQRFRHSLAQRQITGKQKSRQTIFHHRRQFGRRLPRVKRHDNNAFRKQREIESHPPCGVRREQRATLARLKSRAAQMRADALHLFEQFPSRNTDELLSMNFAQHDAAIGLFELRENILEKIRHGG